MNSAVWPIIGALAVCVVLSAFFSASETAFSALNLVRLKMMVQDGKKGAANTLKLAEQYDRLITTILIGNNIVNIAASGLATVLFTGIAGEMGVTLSTIVMTMLILIFGEVTPKTLAKNSPEKVAVAFTRPLTVLMILFRPIDLFFVLLRKQLAMIVKNDDENPAIEDELITMVDTAQNEGDMDAHESELIRSAIEFNDRDALSIMTPRVDVAAVDGTATMDETAALFRESGYSRLVVFDEDMDHIIGILREKDFYMGQYEGVTDIRNIMNPAVFAPVTIGISKLLKLFQSSATHMVVLLDEFGGTEGIVTMEDVLEELVGEIYDENDDVSEELVSLPDGSYQVDGSMQLDELLETLSIENEYDADTAGGWAAEMLGCIPDVGSTFEVDGYHCEVTEMEKRRVIQLVIRKTEPDNKQEKE